MSHGLPEHLRVTQNRIQRWLTNLPPEERIEALAELRDSIRDFRDMEETTRRDTLIELVTRHGLETVAESLGVTPDRLARAMIPRS